MCPEAERIPPKSHLPAVSFPQKIYSNRPFRFLHCSSQKCYCQTDQNANWRGLKLLPFVKFLGRTFSFRLFVY